MRIRLFGQYVHASIAVLTATEALIFFASLILAALGRAQFDMQAIEGATGALWPRALVFSVVMIVSLLAFGLYSARQRARPGGLLVRAVVAIAVGLAVTT